MNTKLTDDEIEIIIACALDSDFFTKTLNNPEISHLAVMSQDSKVLDTIFNNSNNVMETQ